MEDNYYKKERMNFRDIVLDHLKKILELSRVEFTGGYTKNIPHSDGSVEKVYVPDTRKSYWQSIESLADILLPFFDADMKTDYKTITVKVEELQMSYDKTLPREKMEILFKKKMQLMREMFQKLNLLMHRIDYLKSSIYTEESEGSADD